MYKWFGRVGIVTGSWVEKYENHRREEGVRTVIKILKFFSFDTMCIGASSPVGMSICKELVEHGMIVCALARPKGIIKLEVSWKLGKFFWNLRDFSGIVRGLRHRSFCECNNFHLLNSRNLSNLQPDFSNCSFKFPWHHPLAHLHPLTSTEISKIFLSGSPWKQQCSA